MAPAALYLIGLVTGWIFNSVVTSTFEIARKHNEQEEA